MIEIDPHERGNHISTQNSLKQLKTFDRLNVIEGSTTYITIMINLLLLSIRVPVKSFRLFYGGLMPVARMTTAGFESSRGKSDPRFGVHPVHERRTNDQTPYQPADHWLLEGAGLQSFHVVYRNHQKPWKLITFGQGVRFYIKFFSFEHVRKRLDRMLGKSCRRGNKRGWAAGSSVHISTSINTIRPHIHKET